MARGIPKKRGEALFGFVSIRTYTAVLEWAFSYSQVLNPPEGFKIFQNQNRLDLA
jgi:hypothetical protein